MYLKISYMENKPLNRIKVMLAERMVSNKDLAEMLGKDPATISKWVTNTSQPTLENLIEIGVRLPKWLVTGLQAYTDKLDNLDTKGGK